MTINVKNNRDETLTGNITLTGNLSVTTGKVSIPSTTGVSAATTGIVRIAAVYDSAGVKQGYLKIYGALS